MLMPTAIAFRHVGFVLLFLDQAGKHSHILTAAHVVFPWIL